MNTINTSNTRRAITDDFYYSFITIYLDKIAFTHWPFRDKDSAGFEHASILSDLDGDGVDELYVASDRHKELRRYVWNGSKLVREVIYARPDDRSIFTWNLMPVPVEIIP